MPLYIYDKNTMSGSTLQHSLSAGPLRNKVMNKTTKAVVEANMVLFDSYYKLYNAMQQRKNSNDRKNAPGGLSRALVENIKYVRRSTNKFDINQLDDKEARAELERRIKQKYNLTWDQVEDIAHDVERAYRDFESEIMK